MSANTRIEYADSSVNPVMGCGGCELLGKSPTCYAYHMTNEWAGGKGWPKNFLKPEMFPDRMATAIGMKDLRGTKRIGKPWLDGKRRHIFLTDMGDQFDQAIPFEFTASVVDAMKTKKGERHFYFLFTKRARRMAEFVEWYRKEVGLLPANVIWMVSVTDAKTLVRLDTLLSIPDITRGVSLEPLLGPVALLPTLAKAEHDLHWCVAGSESGRNYRACKGDWVRGVRDDCAEAGVPFFLKQAADSQGEKLSVPKLDGKQHTAMFNPDGDLLV